MEEIWQDTLNEARLLELEIRDYLQLEVGNLSLQESRNLLSCQRVRSRRAGEVGVTFGHTRSFDI